MKCLPSSLASSRGFFFQACLCYHCVRNWRLQVFFFFMTETSAAQLAEDALRQAEAKEDGKQCSSHVLDVCVLVNIQ
jgi:hypothetical protein